MSYADAMRSRHGGFKAFDNMPAERMKAGRSLRQLFKAQAEGSNSAGGYLAPVELADEIIRLVNLAGTFRRNATVIEMSSDVMLVPRRTGGLTATVIRENAEISASSMSWGQVALNAVKRGVLVQISSELNDDQIASAADALAWEMGHALAKAEDDAGWNGTGSAADGGVTGVATKIVDGTHTKSAINALSTHDTFAEIDNNDLASLIAAVPEYVLPTASFYVSNFGFASVFARLAGTSGAADGVDGRRTYLGFPVELVPSLPQVGTSLVNLPMLYFGDLSLAAILGSRRGVTISTTPNRYLEYDLLGVKATSRWDINVHDLGDNTTAGPLVALVGA